MQYLLPRRLADTGLTAEQLSVEPETFRWIISRYTREAGVRDLERSLGRIARKVAGTLPKETRKRCALNQRI